ncbi:F-box protein 22 [Sarotherodon galilaeus]
MRGPDVLVARAWTCWCVTAISHPLKRQSQYVTVFIIAETHCVDRCVGKQARDRAVDIEKVYFVEVCLGEVHVRAVYVRAVYVRAVYVLDVHLYVQSRSQDVVGMICVVVHQRASVHSIEIVDGRHPRISSVEIFDSRQLRGPSVEQAAVECKAVGIARSTRGKVVPYTWLCDVVGVCVEILDGRQLRGPGVEQAAVECKAVGIARSTRGKVVPYTWLCDVVGVCVMEKAHELYDDGPIVVHFTIRHFRSSAPIIL